MVSVPFAPGDPYDNYPFVRRYPMLEAAAIPAYARSKDQMVSGSLSRVPSPTVTHAPRAFADMVPRWAHVDVSEGGGFDRASLDFGLDDDDDLEDVSDVLEMRYGAAEAQKKLRPFKAVSELFKPAGNGKSKADQLVEASERLERKLHEGARRVERATAPRPAVQMTTGQAVAAAAGVAVFAFGLGFLASRPR